MKRARAGINTALSVLITVCVLLGGYGATLVTRAADQDTHVLNASADFTDIIRKGDANKNSPNRQYLSVTGASFGIKLYLEGVVVVGSEEILTSNGYIDPSKLAGLQNGDMITHADGIKISKNVELSEILAKSKGEAVVLTIVRSGQKLQIPFYPVLCQTDNRYKAGLWVRDSSAGIGTLSFFDEKTGMFCGLGHGVNDSDTGKLIPFSRGEAYGAEIIGIKKGTSSQVGELSGVFTEDTLGDIIENSEIGVYGRFSKMPDNSVAYPLGQPDKIYTGKAQILSTVDENGAELYDIEITQINNDSSTKNIVISVTDADLIIKTGGIVQGMSGSPIIQNGCIVGVVTHVFVDNPQGGFGIFAQTMLNRMNTLDLQTKSAA